MTCRWCGGPLTWIKGQGVRWTACMRCDTDQHGGGSGPPVFVRIWNARRADLGHGHIVINDEGSEEP